MLLKKRPAENLNNHQIGVKFPLIAKYLQNATHTISLKQTLSKDTLDNIKNLKTKNILHPSKH